jgi:hypothetical protein
MIFSQWLENKHVFDFPFRNARLVTLNDFLQPEHKLIAFRKTRNAVILVRQQSAAQVLSSVWQFLTACDPFMTVADKLLRRSFLVLEYFPAP